MPRLAERLQENDTSKKAREAAPENQAVPASGSQTEQPETDVGSVSGSTRPKRGKSNSAVDSPNARDANVLPDEVARKDNRTIPRASDLERRLARRTGRHARLDSVNSFDKAQHGGTIAICSCELISHMNISIKSNKMKPTKNMDVRSGVSSTSCASVKSSSVTRYSSAATPNDMTASSVDVPTPDRK
jgi:hypothetical protein